MAAAEYRVQVIADRGGAWTGNALTFPTAAAAREYASNLWGRWTAVTDWRVVTGSGRVVARMGDGRSRTRTHPLSAIENFRSRRHFATTMTGSACTCGWRDRPGQFDQHLAHVKGWDVGAEPELRVVAGGRARLRPMPMYLLGRSADRALRRAGGR